LPMEQTKRLDLAKESYVLLTICLLDLTLTMWLLVTGRAVEGNPIMSYYLDQGWDKLIGAKILLVVFPLFIAEWGRRHRPQFVRRMLRFAIAAYIGIYALAFTNTDILARSKPSVSTPPETHQRASAVTLSSTRRIVPVDSCGAGRPDAKCPVSF